MPPARHPERETQCWFATRRKFDQLVEEGRRSPGTVDTYRRQLKNHVLPAMGEVRLGEATTPLVDRVVAAIRTEVSPATARSCRSVISGVLGLAVRYGAIGHNPIREVARIEAKSAKPPRALTSAERVQLLVQLQQDDIASRGTSQTWCCSCSRPG